MLPWARTQIECEGSLLIDMCVLQGSPEELAATCDAEQRCDAFGLFVGVTLANYNGSAPLGVLKTLGSTLDLTTTNYSPFGMLLVRDSVVVLPVAHSQAEVPQPLDSSSSQSGNDSAGGGAVNATQASQPSYPVLTLSEGSLQVTGDGGNA